MSNCSATASYAEEYDADISEESPTYYPWGFRKFKLYVKHIEHFEFTSDLIPFLEGKRNNIMIILCPRIEESPAPDGK